jgi:hypothetical protein
LFSSPIRLHARLALPPRSAQSERRTALFGHLDKRAQAEVPSDGVGGQPLVAKGIQPPPPEPDGHVYVHPALQCQVLRMKADSPIRATSTLVEPSTCPPSSCPGHYPRRWATTGTLSPWALLPVGDPVVVCRVRSTFRASVRPLPRLIAGGVLPEDHGERSTHPVRQESGYQRLSRRCRNAPTGTGVQAIQPCPCVA